jgi:glycolate oxidase FAD binding subunit
MTEVTIKVLPAPETELTVLLHALEPAEAVAAMTAAMGSACDVSGAAHLPVGVAARVPRIAAAGGSGAVTALRLEGFAPSVAHRRRAIEILLKAFGEITALEASASRVAWHAIRDVTPLAAAGGESRPLWRISTAPARGAELAATIAAGAEVELLFDWAGGLLWAALAPSDDASAALVRRAVAATGGHATLVRGPAALRAAIAAFEPQDGALAALTKRVKESFDPNGVLNPGRMWAGV